MNSQIYLLLLRQSGSYKDWAKEFKNVSKTMVPILLKQILKDIVMGDSLDAPFVKFIRVSNVSHSLSFGSDSSFEEHGWAYEDSRKAKYEYAPNPYLRGTKTTSTPFANTAGFEAWGKHQLRESIGIGSYRRFGGNQFVQNRIPEHGEIKFTKYIDSATPQLAYGCAAQEKFPLAIFFYRRMTGLGIGGIRFPYFVMGAFKCKIKDWSLKGDVEDVSLYYRTISWCGYEQFSDTNVSVPWSTRWFDQEKSVGGQGGAAIALQILTAGLVAIAGGVSKSATGDAGADKGSASDL